MDPTCLHARMHIYADRLQEAVRLHDGHCGNPAGALSAVEEAKAKARASGVSYREIAREAQEALEKVVADLAVLRVQVVL